ncbi:hypothetical protein V6S67_07880 [Arthrobacter sp. Soc17.1.1.1]|uniref:hypothetical protein n=1 Tax=Arthrobacter sp. Soc17.1.1.1 TaxID=3121277 RepID=UPI002FE4A366
MPVVIESYGYPAVFDEAGEVVSGAIDAAIGAKYWPAIQSGRFTALGKNDWKVTAQVGVDRGIRVNAGTIVGDAIMDTLPQYDTFSLPAVTSGTQRWYMVVARRSWTDPAFTRIMFLPGFVDTTALPERSDDPGRESDQPLALCLVEAGKTVIEQIIDLRVHAGGSGSYYAYNGQALQYLESPGAEVFQGGELWRYMPLENGNWGFRSTKQETTPWRGPEVYGNAFRPFVDARIGWNGVQFRIANGTAHLSGAVLKDAREVNPNTAPAGTAMFRIPRELAPARKTRGIDCVVETDGNVTIVDPVAPGGAVSLSASWAVEPGEV